MTLIEADAILISKDYLNKTLSQPPLNPSLITNNMVNVKGMVILDISELRELYNDGYDEGKGQIMEMDAKQIALREKSFKEHLQSNGIKI